MRIVLETLTVLPFSCWDITPERKERVGRKGSQFAWIFNYVCSHFSQTLFAYLSYKGLRPRPDYFKQYEFDVLSNTPHEHRFHNHGTGSIILLRLLSFNLMMKNEMTRGECRAVMGWWNRQSKCRSIENEVKQSLQIYERHLWRLLQLWVSNL